jgi:hypothetical protein
VSSLRLENGWGVKACGAGRDRPPPGHGVPGQ